jgi:hypothetical protein
MGVPVQKNQEAKHVGSELLSLHQKSLIIIKYKAGVHVLPPNLTGICFTGFFTANLPLRTPLTMLRSVGRVRDSPKSQTYTERNRAGNR